MKLFLTVICVSCFVSLVTSCDINQADTCAHNAMLVGNRESIVPTNDGEMDAYCKNVKTNMGCLQDYSGTCLKDMAKAVSGMIITNALKHIDIKCTNPKEKATFIENIKCLADKSKTELMSECMDKHIIQAEALKQVPKEMRKDASCCIFHYFDKCMDTEVAKVCGAKEIAYMEQLADEVMGEAMTMVCADMATIEQCDAKFDAKVWGMLKDLANTNDPAVLAKRHKYKSVVAPMLELMDAP